MSKQALIVDDSRLACKVMAKMLDSFGIQNSEVYSAEEALESLRLSHPDIIFLDHTMPGMDGLEMIKILKANPKTKAIPVLMYTSKEGEFYTRQARELGAFDVLPKGLEEIHLRDALARLGMVKAVKPMKTKEADRESQETPVTADLASDKKLSEQSDWLSFWNQRLAPYLEQQKSQQQKEMKYNTNQQTRKFIREMHLTLEQFEHALVTRMESHADFVASTEEVARSGRRKWLASIGALVVVLQAFTLWYLWKSEQNNNQIIAALESHKMAQTASADQLSILTDKLTAIQVETLAINSQLQAKQEVYATLVTEQGEFIADLFYSDANKQHYTGWTQTGYQVHIDVQTQQVGEPIVASYYLSNNCSGDVFIEGDKGNIYRDSNNNLWYIERQLEPFPVEVSSVRGADSRCVEMAQEKKELYLLTRNNSVVTGVEQNSQLKLSSSQ